MMERPILFSGPMVRAILDGRKTQTRRVVNHPPFEATDEGIDVEYAIGYLRCPYGQPGDLLWVKENCWLPPVDARHMGVQYDADATAADLRNAKRDLIPLGWRHTSSLMTPRWASRLLLRVTEVRVERLWEITQEDAIAEGIERIGDRFKGYMRLFTGEEYNPALPKTSFAQLWETINAKRGYGWDSNPWVWVLSFEVVK